MISRIQWPSLGIQGLEHGGLGIWDLVPKEDLDLAPEGAGVWVLIGICAPVVRVSGFIR